MAQTYYEILGVAPDASLDSINTAFQAKLKALQESHQPDRNQLMVLREVHQALSNPLKREMYDTSLKRPPKALLTESPVVESSQATIPVRHIVLALAFLLVLGLGFAVIHYYKKNQAVVVSPPQPLTNKTQEMGDPEDFGGVQPGNGSNQPDAADPRRNGDPNANPNSNPNSNPDTRISNANNGAERNAEQIFTERSVSIARINVSNASGRSVSHGSGVVIGPGSVITNCHVTHSGSTYQVKIGENSYPAQIEIEDRDYDLCKLRVNGLNAPAVPLGKGQALHSGQKVFAIGAPHGLDLTISDGIVSALRDMPGGKVIQTTAPVSPGSSGGGLFDAWGNLVGIVTFQHREGQNLNFAVPAEWIGDMRQRTSNEVIGSLTRPQGRDNDGRSGGPEQKLLGSWFCISPVRSTSMEIEFRANGRLTGRREGKDFGGSYSLTGKFLRMSSNGVLEGELEEFNSSRFIMNMGNGFRLVCDRRS